MRPTSPNLAAAAKRTVLLLMLASDARNSLEEPGPFGRGPECLADLLGRAEPPNVLGDAPSTALSSRQSGACHGRELAMAAGVGGTDETASDYRHRRARLARAARRAKYGVDGEHQIARKAHAAASDAAGGAAELARRGHAAAAAAAGGAVELARQAAAARVAANPLGSTGVAIQRGIGNAIAAGKYTKYAGVRFRRETGKWRVQFKCQGQLHTVGQCVLLVPSHPLLPHFPFSCPPLLQPPTPPPPPTPCTVAIATTRHGRAVAGGARCLQLRHLRTTPTAKMDRSRSLCPLPLHPPLHP